MNKQRLQYLVQQYLADAATPHELEEMSEILKADIDRELFKDVLERLAQHEPPAFLDNHEPWRKMMHDITGIDKMPVISVKEKKARVLRLFKWAAAAAVLLAVSISIYLFMPHMPHAGYSSNDAENYTIISAAAGDNVKVVLPDSTHVWLNAASSIRFQKSFSGNERLVELNGEGWFDVQHDEKKPFIIRSGILTTTVLGTAFDIKAYPGQKYMTVSVQRGKVKVQAGDKLMVMLEPGKQVRVDTDTLGSVNNIDASNIAGWRSGNLYYKDETMEDVVADLQRIFKDSVQINSNALKSEKITVSFNKDIGMQKALEIISGITNSTLSKKDGKFSIE